jgi:hypothetical protein
MNKPIKARPLNSGDEAWFYMNPKSIDVYCYRKGGNAYSCRITKAQILKWLKAVKDKK